jgi:hypothetical protein
MRRFRRWLFNGLAALSLAVFALMIALCVRSYWREDIVRIIARSSGDWFITSDACVLGVSRNGFYSYVWTGWRSGPAFWTSGGLYGPGFGEWRRGRFRVWWNTSPVPEGFGVEVPHWFVAALAAVLPVIWLGPAVEEPAPSAGRSLLQMWLRPSRNS